MTEFVFSGPSLVDIQVNGFAGVDYNSPDLTVEDIQRSLEVIRGTGVSKILPTVITAPREQMLACLKALRKGFDEAPLGRSIAGFHVEGPHLSPEDGPRGAHPISSIRPPEYDEFAAWQDVTGSMVRIVTVSPHWPQAPRYIERVVAQGTRVSIGHTHASLGELDDAVRAGATMSTHLGNAAHPVLPKVSNYIWQQLADDRLTASFIADGIHVPEEFLRPAIRAKGLQRSVLITDASSPAGAAPGRYRLGSQEVELTASRRVVLAGQDRLAGSALKLNDAVARIMRVLGLSANEALEMASANAARAAGIPAPQEKVLWRFAQGNLSAVEMSS